MDDPLPVVQVKAPRPPLGMLGWIAAYKFVKALLALAAALMLMRLLHEDLAATLLRWEEFFGMGHESQLTTHLMERVKLINPSRLHLAIGVSLAYMVMYLIEGGGLLAEKRWAEWFTVVQSGILLPWEIHGVIKHPDWIRFTVLSVNLLVIAYLLWRIRRETRAKSHL